MTETRIGNFFLLSNNSRSNSNAFQEPNSINSDSELQNFEAVASLVVHQNRILAKEEQYCLSLQEHYNESESKRQKLEKDVQESKQNIEAYERREQILYSTQNKLEESLRACRIRLNEFKKKVENNNIKRKNFLRHISSVSGKHEKIFREMKNKYPEELDEENESLYMKLDNLQRIRNQLKNKLNALQNEENGKTFDWNLWKEQVIRLAELLKPIKPPTTKNTLSPFELLFERKKLGCQRSKSCPSVPSDDRTPTIERAKETNYSPIPKNINSQFTLRPSENSQIFQQEQQHIPESVNKFSNKPQISATFKLSKLNLPTLKVPSFGLLFRNASSFVEKKIPSGGNEGERPKVRDSFHKGQVDDNRERQDVVKGNKHNVAGNNVHSAVEETPPQRPVPENRIEKEKCGIGKDLREEARKELPGKSLQQKNIFKSFLSSFTVLKGPPRKVVDTHSFTESSNPLKSPNFATEICNEKDTVNHEEEVRVPTEQRNKKVAQSEEVRVPTEQRNKKVAQSVTRDLENENTQMEVTMQTSKYTGVVPEDGSKDDNVVEEDASENMEMTEGELTESHADNMELADFENNINKPNCNPENEQNRDVNTKEHVEIVSNTTDEVEMEVSTSDNPESNEVVMMPPTIHKQQQQQQPQETFNSHFSFSLFDQQDDFMSSFTEKGTGFSLYGSPNQEQGENKNVKGNSTGSNFLFGTMESPSPSFSFSFQGGAEEDPTEEATTSRSSHDFFSLFSSPSTDQSIQSSQPSFNLF